jgi:hypothetical protein
MAGYTANKFGRRRTIQIGSAIAAIGGSTAVTTDRSVALVSRVLGAL